MPNRNGSRVGATGKIHYGFLLGVLVLLLSSCGFQLRGAYQLPPQMHATWVNAANPNSALARSLKRTLNANGIRLVESQSSSSAVLRLFGEKNSKRVISVDSRGQAREYELSYSISFSLSLADNTALIAEQTLSLQRDFLFDTTDVLGKGREESTLVSDMQQDMVRLIMLRLQAAAQSPDAAQ